MNELSFSEIIDKTKENKEFANEYLKFLYTENNINIICERPLAAIKCFIPLPTCFDINSIFYTNNNSIKNTSTEYMFHGIPGNRLMFADSCAPSPLLYKINDINSKQKFISSLIEIPIPFSFPLYTDNNELEIISSNVYYYEVTLKDKININNTWPSQCISVGFAYKDTIMKSHVGWFNNSIGFHSDDGTIRFNNEAGAPIISRSWEAGDTVGIGLIYYNSTLDNSFGIIQPNREVKNFPGTIVLPFITFNGSIIYVFKNPIKLFAPYFPTIGYDHPNSINVNFSTSKFKFNIKDFIIKHSKEVISTNNTFIDNNTYINNILTEEISYNIAYDTSYNNINFGPSGYINAGSSGYNEAYDTSYNNMNFGPSGYINAGSSGYNNMNFGHSGYINNYNNLPLHFNFPSNSFSSKTI